jgi:16S rRNA (guanine527-N7)-methyltransferase
MLVLERYQQLVVAEADKQNLVSRSTLAMFQKRHLLDSAQLCRLVEPGSRWLDVGSGAGLPGMVIAIITGEPVTLVEPRRLRSDFLRRCIGELGLRNAQVVAAKVERVEGLFDAITARAVASLDALLGLTYRLSHAGTRWVLPKGRSAAFELAEAQGNWQGLFTTVPSITSDDAAIVVVEQLRPKSGAGGRSTR